MENVADQELKVNQKSSGLLTKSEKFLLGCKALGGQPVRELSKESGVSRTWIYQQKEDVTQYASMLDEQEEAHRSIQVTEQFIERLALSLALDCRGPLEGIERTFRSVIGVNLSIGKISAILNDASRRAVEFDRSILLDMIRQGANDEIFQCSEPVLTGIDVESTYIYLLEPALDRTGETWQLYMEDCKERGLELDVNISDAGSGLQAGIPKAFPEISMQADVFHALRPIGAEIASAERRVYRLIAKEYDLEERVQGARPRKKTREQLEQVRETCAREMESYDILATLYAWLVELLGFSGYSFEETCSLCAWVLSEMMAAAPGKEKFRHDLEKLRNNLPQVLSFLKRMEVALRKASERTGIPIQAFQLFYQKKSCAPLSWESSRIEYALGELLCNGYADAKAAFEQVLSTIKRASSLVENLNGRIRPFMDLKRVIPDRFFALLKVYFNTKRYRRSRIPERVGKSPIELLTGKPCAEFLETLGY